MNNFMAALAAITERMNSQRLDNLEKFMALNRQHKWLRTIENHPQEIAKFKESICTLEEELKDANANYSVETHNGLKNWHQEYNKELHLMEKLKDDDRAARAASMKARIELIINK